MSKCNICMRELVTGDVHWEIGMCNECYNKHINNFLTTNNIPVDYKYLYENAIKYLDEVKEEVKRIKEINLYNKDLAEAKLKQLKGENNE